MSVSAVPPAVAVAKSIASTLGLRVDDAIVLQASNRLTLCLLPCDVLARATVRRCSPTRIGNFSATRYAA